MQEWEGCRVLTISAKHTEKWMANNSGDLQCKYLTTTAGYVLKIEPACLAAFPAFSSFTFFFSLKFLKHLNKYISLMKCYLSWNTAPAQRLQPKEEQRKDVKYPQLDTAFSTNRWLPVSHSNTCRVHLQNLMCLKQHTDCSCAPGPELTATSLFEEAKGMLRHNRYNCYHHWSSRFSPPTLRN